MMRALTPARDAEIPPVTSGQSKARASRNCASDSSTRAAAKRMSALFFCAAATSSSKRGSR
jgi:hypothetical protein